MVECFNVYYIVVFLILVGSTSSEGQKVGFFFFFKMLLVFRVEGSVISWVEWARFQFGGILESHFFRFSVRGGSSASVYRLSTGEVPYAPRPSLSPWWCMVFSSYKYAFLTA